METASIDDRDTVEAVDGVHLAQLAVGDETSVQHFDIEPGAEVPGHDHRHEQAGFLYEGELTFRLDGGERVVSAGDSYVLRGDELHAVANEGDEPARGVDIFSPPRANPDWLD